ncbi:MAG: hypothetical protein V3U10_04240 [Bacteroidota bacterium]
MPFDVTLQDLRQTVEFAYRTTPLYQQLYQRKPVIRSFEDFIGLPIVTDEVVRRAGGLLECLSVRDIRSPHSVLCELNPFSGVASSFPYTPVENETDCEYRYVRVEAMLKYAGLEKRELLILADQPNMYFAADLEHVLFNYAIAIILCDGVPADELAGIAALLQPRSIVVMTSAPIPPEVIPASCRRILTFCNFRSYPARTPFRVFDVYSTHALPWVGIRSQNEVAYRSNELFLDDEGELEVQVHLEKGKNGHLLVTVIADNERSPLLPLVRFDTGDQVESVDGSRFVIP